MAELKNNLSKMTAEHLYKIGKILSSSSAAASRIYMCNLERYLSDTPSLLDIGPKREHLYCKHCGSLFTDYKNHRVRVLPRPSLNRHLKKLLKIEAEEPWKINNQQRKKIKTFLESTNKVVYSCLVCGKKTKFNGTKTFSAKRKVTTSLTPLSKVKVKKGDLNAGLFISPKINQNISENIPKHLDEEESLTEECASTSKEANTSDLTENTFSFNTPINQNKSKNFKYQATPNKSKTPETLSAQKQGSGKKRKQTLLEQIIKQEKQSKKKTSLSSFLVSL